MPKVNDVGITIKPGMDRGDPIPGAADAAMKLLDTNANPAAVRVPAGEIRPTSQAMDNAAVVGNLGKYRKGNP